MMKRKWKLAGLTISLTALLMSTACGSKAANSPSEVGAAKPVEVTQVTSWFAQPEHGGQYTALEKGFYKDAGLQMTIQPGSPQVSPIQVVASGKAQFGMGNGDDVLIARSQGIPLVAIAAIFQESPQALAVHNNGSVKDFKDLNGKKVYVVPGIAYWQFIKKKYQLDQVQEMNFTGNLNVFITDPNASTQTYVTDDPFTLKKQGVDATFLRIDKSGYSPYSNVLYTTEKYMKEHPDVVKAYVEATVKGWEYYKDHADEMMPVLQKYNPDLKAENIKFGAETEMSMIFGGDAAKNGFGTMSAERWTTLIKQLKDLGLITKEEPAENVFTTKFLPKK